MRQDFNDNSSRKLIDFVEGFERVQVMIDDLKLEQKDIKNAARSNGWDMRGFNELIKLRKLSADEREDWFAIRELMLREVGMLADTPLGGAALRRFEKSYQPPSLPESPQEPQDGSETPDTSNGAAGYSSRLPARPRPIEKTPEEVEAERKAEFEEAKELGRKAARSWNETKDPQFGVLNGPYLGFDPRRIPWDQGWREIADPFDLAPHLKRKEKPKKPKKGEGEE